MTADDGVFTVPGRQRASSRHLYARTGRLRTLLLFAYLWVSGACLTVVSRGTLFYVSSLLSFCHEWQFYLCWPLPACTFQLFSFRRWCKFLGSFPHHGHEPAKWVLRPWLSFLSFLALCPCCYLLAQQEGEVFCVQMFLLPVPPSVRNGPGQSEGFQANFEAAGPGR